MSYSDRHLFFDLDRTLWDFDANSEFALRTILEQEKLLDACHGFEHFHKVYRNKNAALWKKYGQGKLAKEALRYERFRATLKVYGLHDEDQIKRIGDAYVEISPRQTRLFPNAIEVLTDLKTMGFTLHIITNGFTEVQYEKLNNCLLSPFFDVVVCSEHIGYNKPHQKIFKHALDLAGAKPENSLMVGDDYHADIAGALQSGMQAIWFEPNLRNTLKFEHRIYDLNEVPQKAAMLLR